MIKVQSVVQWIYYYVFLRNLLLSQSILPARIIDKILECVLLALRLQFKPIGNYFPFYVAKEAENFENILFSRIDKISQLSFHWTSANPYVHKSTTSLINYYLSKQVHICPIYLLFLCTFISFILMNKLLFWYLYAYCNGKQFKFIEYSS